MTEKKYCIDCKHYWCDCGEMQISQCHVILKEIDTSVCREPVYGKSEKLNAKNDCKYYVRKKMFGVI